MTSLHDRSGNQRMLERITHEIRIAIEGQLGQYAGPIRTDRGSANKQGAGNFLDRCSRGQHLEDLELSVRENLMKG